MKLRRIDVILSSFLLLSSLQGCGGVSDNAIRPAANAANSNSEKTISTKTNVEELGMLVNIPYEAEESVWRDYASQKKLIAVLKFSAADSDKLVAAATRVRAPESVTIQSEPWFPDELIAQGGLSGDVTLKGSSYAANAFFQDSFNDGRIIRVEGTTYFVLELSAK